jgi:hypothetical protein
MHSHGPAHHAPRKQIKDDCQVKPALGCLYPRDVGHPFGIGRLCAEIPLEQVVGDRICVLTVSRDRPMRPTARGEAELTHQAHHPFASAGLRLVVAGSEAAVSRRSSH